jgi:curved DNA-binding protein
MFGGQNFHDFARGQGQGVDLDEILRQMFGGGAGGGFGGFGGGQQGGFGGFGGPDLDMQARIVVPFMVSITGGKHNVTANGQSFDIKIPAGIKSGETMRVRGKGKQYQGQAGDLLIKVDVSASDEYERKGDNLYKTFDVPLKEALFGGKIAVNTPEKEVSLKVPTNTKNGQKFRLKGKGVADRKTALKGDLYLVANVVLPDVGTLDDDVVASMLEIHPQTLRQYEREGLVEPSRTQGRMRLYSQRDIDRMKLILRLTRQMGVNLAGVDIVLQLKEQIDQMQSEIDQLRDELSKVNRNGSVHISKALVTKNSYDIIIFED